MPLEFPALLALSAVALVGAFAAGWSFGYLVRQRDHLTEQLRVERLRIHRQPSCLLQPAQHGGQPSCQCRRVRADFERDCG